MLEKNSLEQGIRISALIIGTTLVTILATIMFEFFVRSAYGIQTKPEPMHVSAGIIGLGLGIMISGMYPESVRTAFALLAGGIAIVVLAAAATFFGLLP